MFTLAAREAAICHKKCEVACEHLPIIQLMVGRGADYRLIMLTSAVMGMEDIMEMPIIDLCMNTGTELQDLANMVIGRMQETDPTLFRSDLRDSLTSIGLGKRAATISDLILEDTQLSARINLLLTDGSHLRAAAVQVLLLFLAAAALHLMVLLIPVVVVVLALETEGLVLLLLQYYQIQL
jgi:hypothetical protein